MAQTALPALLLCPQQQLRLAGRLKSSNPGAGSEEAKCQEQQAEQCHEFPPLKESDREYFDGPEQFRALVSLEKFQVVLFFHVSNGWNRSPGHESLEWILGSRLAAPRPPNQ